MAPDVDEDLLGDELFVEIYDLSDDREAMRTRIDAMSPYENELFRLAINRARGRAAEDSGVALSPDDQALWDDLVRQSAPENSRWKKGPTWN